MSQSPKSPKNTNIFSELSSITVENKAISVPVVDSAPKRGAPDQVDDQVKKIKVEHNSHEEDASKVAPKFDNKPKFVSASEIFARHANTTIENIPEISDEELLAMAIKFEKEHPEYN